MFQSDGSLIIALRNLFKHFEDFFVGLLYLIMGKTRVKSSAVSFADA